MSRMPHTFRKTALATLVGTLSLAMAATPVQAAQQQETTTDGNRGKMLDHSRVRELDAPSSAERESAALAALPPSAFTEPERRMVLQAAAPSEPWRQAVTMEDRLDSPTFASGKADILPGGKTALDALVARLRGKDKIRFVIIGHTDNQRIAPALLATYPDNRALSEARALAVAQYLRQQLQLGPDAFSVRGLGDSSPIASNDTPEGMAQNRRTALRVWFEEPAVAPPPAASRLVAQDGVRDNCAPGDIPQGLPFSISVDGKPVDTDTPQHEADRQRCVDVALEKADIQIKYDPLNVTPALNAWAVPGVVARGREVQWQTYTNYAWWIKKAEIRVFTKGQNTQETPFAVVPVPVGGQARWMAPETVPSDMGFVLRVYDAKGRFDETSVKPLRLIDRLDEAMERDRIARELRSGWGESSLKIRNISASGGAVTVSGTKVRPDQFVTALGMPVPVDAQGRFVMRQILPAGPHSVEVAVKDAQGVGAEFRRNLSIADKDWFYIAVADLTVGSGRTTGPAALVTGDTQHYDNSTWIDGRGAFYLKGKIKGEYLLTASADTQEQPLKDLFSNFSSKDPNYLLRRIEPDKYYPIYGDDSVIVDDAPTQGKFYVRLEKDGSRVMWGNFQTSWTGTELTQYSRGLYGANAVWSSQDATSFGERRTNINAFAAEPGTLQSREEFRGTGGSLYYLHRQDLTYGSERLWVEIRDKDSGVALQRTLLAPSQDYEINYTQGRLTLRAPLPSVADGSALLQTGSYNGNPVYLVATYEYVPGLTAVTGSAIGLRASHWVNDWLRVGTSLYRQGENGQDQNLKGFDATLRYAAGTWMRMEAAHSRGAGSDVLTSITGGFDFAQSQTSGQSAGARRIDGSVNLSEVSEGMRGRVTGYWQERDAGFSGPGLITPGGEASRQAGVAAVLPVGTQAEVAVKADDRTALSQSARGAEAAVRYKIDPQWGVSAGIRDDSRNTAVASLTTPVGTVYNASPLLSQNGDRTDVIVRFDYRPLAAQQNPVPVAATGVVTAPAPASTGAKAAPAGSTPAPAFAPAAAGTTTGAAGVTVAPSTVSSTNSAWPAAAPLPPAAAPGAGPTGVASVASLGVANAGSAPSTANMGPAASLLPSTAGNMPGVVRAVTDPVAAAGIAASRTEGFQYEPWNLYGFAQHTLRRTGDRAMNDRAGVGGGWQLTDRVRLGAEASGGSGGVGGKLAGDYQLDDRSTLYLTYARETEVPDQNYAGAQGVLTAGGRTRLNDQLGMFAETRASTSEGPRSLTHAFGVDFAPAQHWTTGARYETGLLTDPVAGDLRRDAIGVSVGYKEDRIKLSSAVEFRSDRGTSLGTVAGVCSTTSLPGTTDPCVTTGGDNNRRTILLKNALSYQIDPSWRLLGKFNLSRSTSSNGAFYDGDYTEVVAAAAYRPVNNDRWNTLFKYTYFYNLPSPGQVDSVTSQILDYTQRSHVLNIDTIYDLVPWLSVGAKYGLRVGDLKASRDGTGDWFSSRADLWVLRADLHFVKEWDAIIEARRLRVKEADDARSGFLVGVYRHVAEHVKIGVGYNFTNYSDNLTDLSYRSKGWFLNALSTW